MNSTDLGIYLDTLGVTGKLIRFINWLAPWSLILGGLAMLYLYIVGAILVWVFVLPIVALTILIDIATVAAYKIDKKWASNALRAWVVLVLISPFALIAYATLTQPR